MTHAWIIKFIIASEKGFVTFRCKLLPEKRDIVLSIGALRTSIFIEETWFVHGVHFVLTSHKLLTDPPHPQCRIYAAMNLINIGSAPSHYSVPSHYLNQCWIIVNWIIRHKKIIHENVSEIIVCEMALILYGVGRGGGVEWVDELVHTGRSGTCVVQQHHGFHHAIIENSTFKLRMRKTHQAKHVTFGSRYRKMLLT